MVYLYEASKKARVVVPDNHLSLAIGKEGQNARLAAKLTGWKIDIKSQSQIMELVDEDGNFKDAFAEDEIFDEDMLDLENDMSEHSLDIDEPEVSADDIDEESEENDEIDDESLEEDETYEFEDDYSDDED